jgi:hypothetical protein
MQATGSVDAGNTVLVVDKEAEATENSCSSQIFRIIRNKDEMD